MSTSRLKVMVVFGTRPEAIKMCPLVHALKANADRFETIVCVTAQHRQMLDQVLSAFGVTPDIDLDIMKKGQDLFDITASVMAHMKTVLSNEQPDIVLVHGDTTTAMATSISCFYLGIRLGHVEAGLRTNDIRSPFPEEFNRQIIGKIADWHFCPTERSRDYLLSEGLDANRLVVTGNTVIDALQWTLRRINQNIDSRNLFVDSLSTKLGFRIDSTKYVLITGHRRENFGEGFVQLCEGIRELSSRFQGVYFVYPVHLNPNVQNTVVSILDGIPNVKLIAPLEYEPFSILMQNSHIVLTDSGGIQEEAPSLGKPVLVMRNITERPEAVEAGTVRLVGAHRERIVHGVSELLSDDLIYSDMSHAHNPYGDGKACERIVDALKHID